MRSIPVLRSRIARSVLLLGMLVVGAAGLARAAGPGVVVLTATGVVDNVMAGYLEEGIASATRDSAAAVVVRLNTPGGSLDATQRITSALLEAPVPVIVWVSPSGGRAASAGTFITLAGALAYMAEGTNIGAASPISSTGEDIPGTLGEKVRNDAIANITAIAEARGRNVEWAVATVHDAKSSPASEAVKVGAVDGIANTIEAVVAAADGRTVTVRGVQRTLDLSGARIDELAMNPFQALLHLLSDPNIAAVLFTVGSLGLVYELMNPNFVTGIIGTLAIILAFIGSQSLPLNVGGLLLIALAMLLFVLEVTVVSHGLLTLGGVVCLALGLSALFTAPVSPTGPDVSVALPLIVTVTATVGVLMALVIATAIRSRHMPAPAGTVGTVVPVGTAGVVQSPLGPLGTAQIAGETWSARAVGLQPLPRGTFVRVVGIDGLTALVEPSSDVQPSAPAPSAPADQPT
jgi:membrane-bound serine protease (ClpP class)